MRKFLFLIPFFVFGMSAAAELTDLSGPWMVCEIDVSGNKNIAKKTVIKNSQAKKGLFYYMGYIGEDKREIMNTGNFDSVEVDIEDYGGTKKDKESGERFACHKITFQVEEKHIFDKIEYDGRKHLSKHAITEAMTLKIKDPYNEVKLQGDMDRIAAKYAEKGYINAEVTYQTSFDDAQKTAKVKLIIKEGERARVKEVIIDGADEIAVKKLLKKTANRPGKVYKPQRMGEDFQRMTLYGRNKGYWEYEVARPEVDYAGETNTDIVIKYGVKEGPKADFGQTIFEGNTIFTDEELKKQLYYRPSKLYNQNDFAASVRAIQEMYGNKGYLMAQITPVREMGDHGDLQITLDIEENQVFYVGHVDVSGYEHTKRNVLAREIVLKPGDRFDYSKVNRSIGKLVNLGFINNAVPEISPSVYADTVDVDFNVMEGSAGNIMGGIAMSSLDGLYGQASISHLNLFGTGQRLSVSSMFGENILDYTLSWSTPWVFDRPTSLSLDAFNTRRYRPYRHETRAYTERRIGGRVGVGPRFEEDKYHLGFYYSLQNNEIYDVNPQWQNEIGAGDMLISTLGASFAIDTRDNIWDPTEGWRNSIALDLSGGPLQGDLNDWTISLRSAYNKTLLNIGGNYPIVFVFSNRFSSTKPYGSTKELPVFERYFIGGADTVRGYENTGQIGPETGAEMYFVSNAEIRLPLAREGRRNIAQLAMFLDAGNSWNNFGDLDFSFGPEQNQFKAGVGFGLRFTQGLPIRIDWGYGLNHKDGENRTKFYFNMGASMF